MSGEGSSAVNPGGSADSLVQGAGTLTTHGSETQDLASDGKPDLLVAAVPRAPTTESVLDAALAREHRYVAMLADPATRANVGYTTATPSRADIEAGRTNCSTFIEAVLRDAGYDVDAEVQIGDTVVALHDVINIRAESTTLGDGQELRALVPEVLAAGPNAARVLAELVAARDPRTQGVALALTASHQGTAVATMAELRPGDLVQTWKLVRNDQGELVRARGHSTIVRRVHAVDLDSDEPVILDETTPAKRRRLEVTAVELHGSHFPEGSQADAAGFRAGRSVFTKPAASLDGEFDPWYAARPSRSPWAQHAS